MNEAKYIGLDVHQATISVAILDSAGKLVMEAILETKAETILQFIRGVRGSLHVTFEEGTCAAWLHDLLKSHVAQVLVCDLIHFFVVATLEKECSRCAEGITLWLCIRNCESASVYIRKQYVTPN